ncbi:MAG: hypothetical protein Q9180_007978, partial [Flavoplaca navasiana]
ATFGLESVGLDLSNATGGPPLANQLVAAISGPQYSLGLFGLGRQPTNLSDFSNPRPSFLRTLYDQRSIPSLSWSYTAGARYQSKGVFGSLTLGGYDAGRFVPNDVSFDLVQDPSRELVVGLQSIIASESNGSQHLLLPSPHITFIDSTIPYIYLPLDACALFERVLGLKWNETVQLYLMDDELHRELLTRKPKVTFTLGNSLTRGPTVDIVLPYPSFDLTFKPYHDADPLRYFPLRRAANDSQMTLGRAFLQEAYLITNYEYNNFSVSQCIFEEPITRNIQRILPAGFQEPESTSPQQPSISSEGRPSTGSTLSRSTTIGVIVGSLVGLLLLLGISYRLSIRWSSRRRSRASRSSSEIRQIFANRDDSTQSSRSNFSFQIANEIPESDGRLVQEIDTSDWNFTREIADNGRTELPAGSVIFELPQSNRSATSDSANQRFEDAHRIQSSVDQKRRWGLHFSTDGLLSTGNVIKYWMGLTESYQAE